MFFAFSMIRILIKEFLRTRLKIQIASFLLALFASRFLLFPNLALNGGWDYYNYLFASFLPYILVLLNLVEIGFNAESFFFEGLSVFRKELYRKVLYSKMIIYIFSLGSVLLVDILFCKERFLSLSVFLITLFVSIISVYNYAYCNVRWDIMLKFKHISKYTLFSFISAFLLIILGVLLYLLIIKYGNEFYLPFNSILGMIVLLVSPFVMRNVVKLIKE